VKNSDFFGTLVQDWFAGDADGSNGH
ncbi:MAG: hypothetical protein RL600_871, partial [Actinomycetota bacterium]